MEQLLTIARTGPADEMEQRPYGMVYVVHRNVTGPFGADARLRTVWIIQSDSERPRFVTAYPVQE